MPDDPAGMLKGIDAKLVPAADIANEVGNPKGMNVVLIGALSTTLPFEQDVWEEVIRGRVPPKTIEANLRAFQAGRDSVEA